MWHTKLGERADEGRAERIILKKRRKQDPAAKGLGAVAICRPGSRANDDRANLRSKAAQAGHRGLSYDVALLDLSSNGIMIAAEIPAEHGDNLSLVIEDSLPMTTCVRWVRDGKLGLEFSAGTEIVAEPEKRSLLLDTVCPHKKDQSGPPFPAMSRTVAGPQLVWVAKLLCEGRKATARLRTISESGAILSLSEPLGLTEGAKITIQLATIGSPTGKAGWCAGQEVYVRFNKDFDVTALRDEPCAEISAADATASGSFHGHEVQDDMDHLHIAAVRIGQWQKISDHENRSVSLDELHEMLAATTRPAAAEA